MRTRLSAAILLAMFAGSRPAAAEPASTTCTLDGSAWNVKVVAPSVATNPATGRRLNVNVYDTAGTDLPYLQITALWQKIEGKGKVTIAVKDATPDSPLEAMFTKTPPGALEPPDFVQAGLHYLERGTLTVLKYDRATQQISFQFEGTLREGDPRHPKDHRVLARCTFTGLRLAMH